MTMQFRFRGRYFHEPSKAWDITEWCNWTDLPDLYTFCLPVGSEWQFRKRPAAGVIPDFCPCGYMDKGTCGPAGCPKRAQQGGSAP